MEQQPLACDTCRRSKTKCINQDPTGDDILSRPPCERCTAKNLQCVYSLPKRRGPRPGAKRKMDDVELLSELSSSESSIGLSHYMAPYTLCTLTEWV
jgi:hypothetical protein